MLFDFGTFKFQLRHVHPPVNNTVTDINQIRYSRLTQNLKVFSRWCNVVDFKGHVADSRTKVNLK